MANKPGEANFFPDVPQFPSMGTFQPVYGKFDLTTYIQGASDYEIMAFLVGKYNACLEAYGNITKLSTDTITACKQLQDWVNSWFTNLDAQEEINNKLDSMVADGSFGTLLHQTFDAQINQQTTSAVTAWLVANVTPTGSAVVVDKSLSIEGAAADAAKVGAELKNQKGQTNEGLLNVINSLDSETIVVSEVRTDGTEGNYTVNIPSQTEKYAYKVVVKNIDTSDGYFTLKRYNDNNYSGSSSSTILLKPNATISILTPYTNIKQSIVVENPNNDAKYIVVYKRLIKEDNINLLYKYQYVKNAYTSETDVQAFPTEIIPPNNKTKYLTIKNNTQNDSHFNIEIQAYGNTTYKTSTSLFIKGNSSQTISIGNISVQYIFVKNINLNTDFSLFVFEKLYREIVCCGQKRKFTKFIDALKYANETGNCDVYVDAGEYDLVSEIGESNMPTFIFDNTSGHGIYIGNGTRLFMASGAKVICNYTGTDRTVHRDFAILNACYSQGKGDFEIYGGEFIGSNIRYVVHDEATGISQYTHEYHNCKMTLDNTKNVDWDAKQCIGGGLGQYGTIIIDGGIYNSVGIDADNEKGTITYHNPSSGTSTTFKNNVLIKNAYFETGTCYVSCLGDDTNQDATMFICTNCSMKTEPYANGLDNPYVNHNVTIKKWNNNIRI